VLLGIDYSVAKLLHMRAPGCRPATFPGRMSYKVTEPVLVLFYILACLNCIVAY